MGSVSAGWGAQADAAGLVDALGRRRVRRRAARRRHLDRARHVRRTAARRRTAPRARRSHARARRSGHRPGSPRPRRRAPVRPRPPARSAARPAPRHRRGARPAAVGDRVGDRPPGGLPQRRRQGGRQRPRRRADRAPIADVSTGGSSRSTSSPATTSRPPVPDELVAADRHRAHRRHRRDRPGDDRAAGVDTSGHHDEPTVPLEPDMPALEGFRRVLANLLASVDANLPGTIDDIDAEFLHDLRVAVRRSRSVLRHGKRVLPADVLAWSQPDLKLLGQLTGPPRDLDVLAEEWDGYVDDARRRWRRRRPRTGARPARRRPRRRPPAARGRPRVAAGRRTARPLADVAGSAGGSTGTARRATAGRRRRPAHREGRAAPRSTTAGRSHPDTPAEHVHEVRKDAKRLRYLLECFGSLLPAGERKAFVKRLKALQDNLGEHQDAEVHADMLRTVAGELPVDDAARHARRRRPARRATRAAPRRRRARRSPTASPSTTASRPAEAMRAMLDGAGRVKILATYSIKGGVGKTTAAVNLAYEARGPVPGCCCGTSTRRARRRSSRASSRRSRVGRASW